MPGARHILEVLITGNSRGAIASLDQFEAKANKTFGAATTGVQKFESQLVRGGAVAVGFAAVAGAGMLNAAQSAAVLEQRVTATGKIFKEARGPIDEFAKGAARTAGLSEAEARAASARIGSLLQNAGFSAEQAADKTIALTKRAADLAITMGKPVEEAVNAIAATLRGERDPIEQFGVTLKEMDVTARIAALGLQTGTAAATSNAKAIATLSLVEEQTMYATGAFAAQSDTAAGKLAIFRAEAQNFKANLGQGMLPTLTTVTGALSELAGSFNDLSESQRTMIGSTLAVSTALVGGVGSAALLAGGAMKAARGFSTLAAASPGLAVGLGAAGAAVGLLVGGFALGEAEAAELQINVESLTGALKDLEATRGAVVGAEIEKIFGTGLQNVGAMLDKISQVGQKGPAGFIDQAATQFLDFATSTEISYAKSKKAFEGFDQLLAGLQVSGVPENIDRAAFAFEFLTNAALAQGRSIGEVNREFPQYLTQLEQTADSSRAAAIATNFFADALADVGKGITTERARIDAALGTQKVISATERLTDLQKEQALAGRADSDAARRQADAHRSVEDAVRSHGDAVDRLREAQEDLAEFNSAQEAKIRGLEREQILRRRIGNAEEARQKEIDLYRFDQRVAQEGERLNEGVTDSERGVEDATRRVGDAHQDVADAARDRSEKEKNYAAEIEKAQLDIENAALQVLETYKKTADELGVNTTQAKLLRTELEKILPLVGPDSPIGKLISGAFGGATGFTGALNVLNAGVSGPVVGGAKVLADAQKAGTLNVDALKWVQAGGGPISLPTLMAILGGTFIGPLSQQTKDFLHTLGIPGYQSGGIVGGPVGRPQLAVVHGGEEITPPGTGRSSSSSHLSIVQNNQFVGGDVPTVTQLDAQNRKLGIRVALSGRRG